MAQHMCHFKVSPFERSPLRQAQDGRKYTLALSLSKGRGSKEKL